MEIKVENHWLGDLVTSRDVTWRPILKRWRDYSCPGMLPLNVDESKFSTEPIH